MGSRQGGFSCLHVLFHASGGSWFLSCFRGCAGFLQHQAGRLLTRLFPPCLVPRLAWPLGDSLSPWSAVGVDFGLTAGLSVLQMQCQQSRHACVLFTVDEHFHVRVDLFVPAHVSRWWTPRGLASGSRWSGGRVQCFLRGQAVPVVVAGSRSDGGRLSVPGCGSRRRWPACGPPCP